MLIGYAVCIGATLLVVAIARWRARAAGPADTGAASRLALVARSPPDDRQRQLHAGAHRRRPQLRPQPPRRRPAARARPHPPLRRPAAARRQVRLPARAPATGALVVAGLAAPAPCRRHLRGRAALAAQPAARQRPRRRARRSHGRDHARGDRRALAAAAHQRQRPATHASSWSPTRSWRSHPGTPTAARRPTTRCMSAPASCARWVRSSPATGTSSRGRPPTAAIRSRGRSRSTRPAAPTARPWRSPAIRTPGPASSAGARWPRRRVSGIRPDARSRRRGPALLLRPDRQPAAADRAAGPRHGRAAPGRRLCRRRDGGRRRDRPPPAPAQARSCPAGTAVFERTRTLDSSLRPPGDDALPYRFSADGKELVITGTTPRPWHHVMANPLGHGAIAQDDGEIFSFAGNAQQNALTPCNLDTVPVQVPASALYVVDLATGRIDSAGYTPQRHTDARPRDRLRPRLRHLHHAARWAGARADRVRPARRAGRDQAPDHPQPDGRARGVSASCPTSRWRWPRCRATRAGACRCAPIPGARRTTSPTRATISVRAGPSPSPPWPWSTRSMCATASWAGPSAISPTHTSLRTAARTTRRATTAAGSPASPVPSRCRHTARHPSPSRWVRRPTSTARSSWPSATRPWPWLSTRSRRPVASGPARWAICGSRPASPPSTAS